MTLLTVLAWALRLTAAAVVGAGVWQLMAMEESAAAVQVGRLVQSIAIALVAWGVGECAAAIRIAARNTFRL